ncbi:transposase [bacterium]|nr:transposase [bacterium]
MKPAPLPERHRPAHPEVFPPGHDPVIVFITVCTAARKEILARPEAMGCLVCAWRDAADWLVGRFVLMPDHVHLFCTPAHDKVPPVLNWVKYWKSLASRRWPRQEERPLWQVDCWDRKLRREESYAAKWR